LLVALLVIGPIFCSPDRFISALHEVISNRGRGFVNRRFYEKAGIIARPFYFFSGPCLFSSPARHQDGSHIHLVVRLVPRAWDAWSAIGIDSRFDVIQESAKAPLNEPYERSSQ